MMTARLARQRGLTLVVALVMLVIITMLALTTFNLSKSGIQVVGNMQNRDEAIGSSRRALDEVLSSDRFAKTPLDAVAAPCNASNKKCYDLNGDGAADITTELTPPPACKKARNIRNNELDLAKDVDRDCIVGATQNFGTEGASTGNSMCANSAWELTAVSTDQQTEAQVTVVQGIDVRVRQDDVDTNCK